MTDKVEIIARAICVAMEPHVRSGRFTPDTPSFGPAADGGAFKGPLWTCYKGVAEKVVKALEGEASGQPLDESSEP